MRTPRILPPSGRAVLAILFALSAAPTLWPTRAAHAAADPPLVEAARDGDLEGLRALIEGRADVDATAADGSTALLWAAYRSDFEMAQALLAAGADVDAANDYGVTPLLQASSTGDAPIMRALLEGGADPAIAHPEGQTALMFAARTGHLDAVSLLLEHGADPNMADSFQDETALMWAAAEGHLEVVDALLGAGADPNLRARVNALTERKNADFPTGGFTAVMWAVRNGHEDVVRRLVDGGADLDLTNGDDATATMIAIVNDRFDLAATLVELGAGVDDGSLYHAVEMRDATTDWYARDGSRLRPDHENERTALDLIALLLDAGADPNKGFVGQMHSSSMCCDSFANASPFYRAAIAADVEALKLMIAHGADLEWSPERVTSGGGPGVNANVGRTPLMVAMNGGKGVPLSAGPGYSRQGPPPFREPSDRTPADAVRVLLEAGANPDALTPDGETALHEAVRARKVEIIRALAEGGAKLDIPNRDGFTPLSLAENPLPDKEASVFGPRPDADRASPEEVVAVLRELMQARGYATDSEVASAPRTQTQGDGV